MVQERRGHNRVRFFFFRTSLNISFIFSPVFITRNHNGRKQTKSRYDAFNTARFFFFLSSTIIDDSPLIYSNKSLSQCITTIRRISRPIFYFFGSDTDLHRNQNRPQCGCNSDVLECCFEFLIILSISQFPIMSGGTIWKHLLYSDFQNRCKIFHNYDFA